MVKVCILCVYFGEFPNYFNLWLKSAAYNDTIDFFIFSDQTYDSLPKNVKIYPMTLNEMQRRASIKLGFDVKLTRPYKCCDFKPAYGLIFEEYISAYDYWGHCDLDLIWGDLRYYIDYYKIENYEKFLPLGHLSFYANNTKINQLFKLSGGKDYQYVYSNERNFYFDENPGIIPKCYLHNISFFEERVFADISKIYKRFRLAKQDKNFDRQVFYWERGHIYRAYMDENDVLKDEFMYIHFKERKNMMIHGECLQSNSFYISSTGFHERPDIQLNADVFDKMNPYRGSDYEKKELKSFEHKQQLKRIKRKIARLFHE